MPHLDKKHPAKLRIARIKSTPWQQKYFGKLLFYARLISIYATFSFVIPCIRPFAAVQDENVQTPARYERVSLNTFELYMSTLTSFVEENILHCCPDRFSLVLDRQSTLNARYVAVFATFSYQNAHVFRFVCLKLLQLEDETTQDAEGNITFQRFVLQSDH